MVVLVKEGKRRNKNEKKKERCRDPGSNQGPSDLQSDALPTELSRRFITECNLNQIIELLKNSSHPVRF